MKQDRPSRVDPVNIKPPKSIGGPVMPDKDKILEDSPVLPKPPKPFINEEGQVVVAPAKKSKVQQFIANIRSRVFKAAVQKVTDICIGWLTTFAIYKKDKDGNVVLNDKGEPVILWVSTGLTAVLSFVSAATLTKEAFLGKTWGEVIEIILTNLPF